MPLVQMYLTSPSQYVDFLMPSGRYKVTFVGAQTLYSAADTALYTLQFNSPFTRIKYGNALYLQVSLPNSKHGQIQGDVSWEADYMGAFQMNLYDLSTNAAPIGARFQEGTYWFDVQPITPNQNIVFK